jgi:hypothetical protein
MMEEAVHRLYLLVSLAVAPACSGEGRDTATALAGDGLAAGTVELIPAEWTVAEDTASNGDVTTVSVQLPAARDIGGLIKDESPRLILRCLDGRVAAYIEADPLASADSTGTEPTPIQLDSAPSCE